jgi:hypothetical protein
VGSGAESVSRTPIGGAWAENNLSQSRQGAKLLTTCGSVFARPGRPGREENSLFPRGGTKAQRLDENDLRVFFAFFAPLRLCVTCFWSPRARRMGNLSTKVTKRKCTKKKMLKMKVDPTMFLKAKGRKT